MAFEEHEAFARWVSTQGVDINGLKPAKLPGKGIGIVATKTIKKGERIVFVPAGAIATINTTEFRSKKYNKLSVHGRMAALLMQPPAKAMEKLGPWRTVFPTLDDFQKSIPMFWSKTAQECLPPAAKAILEIQTKKIEKDVKDVSPLIGNRLQKTEALIEYRYYWFLVNTRCFYWDGANQGRRLPRDDCMALCPFIDYFNHGKEGCTVSFDANGYSVHSEYDYEEGEEVTVSYGSHTNDTFLADYGFVLADNEADHVLLDHIIIPKLSGKQSQALKDAGLFGNYALDFKGACHRTQAALRIFLLSEQRWQNFVAGRNNGESEQAQVDALCMEMLQTFVMQAEEMEKSITSARLDGDIDRVLKQRWQQIELILQTNLKTMNP